MFETDFNEKYYADFELISLPIKHFHIETNNINVVF